VEAGHIGGSEAVEEAGEKAGGECPEGGWLENDAARESEAEGLLLDGLHRFPCICCSRVEMTILC
jgi:hypothetical protein